MNGAYEELRQYLGQPFTPRLSEIFDFLEKAQRKIIIAEEYDHLVLSKEEAMKVGQFEYDLALRAIKDILFISIKCERGEWVSMA